MDIVGPQPGQGHAGEFQGQFIRPADADDIPADLVGGGVEDLGCPKFTDRPKGVQGKATAMGLARLH